MRCLQHFTICLYLLSYLEGDSCIIGWLTMSFLLFYLDIICFVSCLLEEVPLLISNNYNHQYIPWNFTFLIKDCHTVHVIRHIFCAHLHSQVLVVSCLNQIMAKISNLCAAISVFIEILSLFSVWILLEM